jgi:membrane protein implicated in regulation of membrane protease activity
MATTMILAIAALMTIVTTAIPAVILTVTIAVTVTPVAMASRSVMVIVVLFVAVTMAVTIVMAVMQQRTQRDKRDRRPDNVMLVIRTGRRAGQGKHQQAANRRATKFVSPLLNHYYLLPCLIMAPL